MKAPATAPVKFAGDEMIKKMLPEIDEVGLSRIRDQTYQEMIKVCEKTKRLPKAHFFRTFTALILEFLQEEVRVKGEDVLRKIAKRLNNKEKHIFVGEIIRRGEECRAARKKREREKNLENAIFHCTVNEEYTELAQNAKPVPNENRFKQIFFPNYK